MSDSFDEFVEALQDQIYSDTKEAYGEIGFERWLHPKYMGPTEGADGYGRVTGSCGDTMEIYLKFEGGRVSHASFQTDGCGASTVCGSFAAQEAHGKTPDELVHITGETILDILGTFPEEDRHCAFLAAETLQEALNEYMMKNTGRKS